MQAAVNCFRMLGASVDRLFGFIVDARAGREGKQIGGRVTMRWHRPELLRAESFSFLLAGCQPGTDIP